MSPVIFGGITSLYLIEGSIFFPLFISPKDLSVRLLEILKVATPILQPVQITEIRLKIIQTL
jgi:hypothetical protein